MVSILLTTWLFHVAALFSPGAEVPLATWREARSLGA